MDIYWIGTGREASITICIVVAVGKYIVYEQAEVVALALTVVRIRLAKLSQADEATFKVWKHHNHKV